MRVPVKAQTKAAHVLAAKIPDHIIGLFVEPVLLEGEDPNLYWSMVSAMVDEHRPQGFLDWIALNDLVTKLWEERVFRRATNAMIRGGQRRAVEQFLTEIRPGEDSLKSGTNKAERRANRYFIGSKKESDEIRSQLAEYGITEAELLARSAQNNSDAILMFEQMVSSRERSRRKLQSEMRRRLPSQGVKSEAYRDANVQRQERTPNQLAVGPIEEAGVRQTSESRPCQGVKAEPDCNDDPQHLNQLPPCQEVKEKMAGEVDSHHHGH